MVNFEVTTDLNALRGLEPDGLQQPEQPQRQQVARDREGRYMIDGWHKTPIVENGLPGKHGQGPALRNLLAFRRATRMYLTRAPVAASRLDVLRTQHDSSVNELLVAKHFHPDLLWCRSRQHDPE